MPVERGRRSGGFRWRDHYWTGPGEIIDEWLEGDDSEIITDRALEFISRQAAANRPFIALVWFHTPHTPLVASNEDRRLYDLLEDPGEKNDLGHRQPQRVQEMKTILENWIESCDQSQRGADYP